MHHFVLLAFSLAAVWTGLLEVECGQVRFATPPYSMLTLPQSCHSSTVPLLRELEWECVRSVLTHYSPILTHCVWTQSIQTHTHASSLLMAQICWVAENMSDPSNLEINLFWQHWIQWPKYLSDFKDWILNSLMFLVKTALHNLL